jgi:hypothetical protein
MRRIWIPLLVGMSLPGLVSESAAAAVTPAVTPLVCQVLPGDGAHPGACGTATAQSIYTAEYTTANTLVAGWTIPNYTVVAGCVADVTFCYLSVPARTFDQYVTVTVHYKFIVIGGAVPAAVFESSSSATATIPAFCGKFFC